MDDPLRVLASSVSHTDIKYKCPYFPHQCTRRHHRHGNNMRSLANTTTHRIINGCCGQSNAHSGVFITINDDTKKIKKRKLSSV